MKALALVLKSSAVARLLPSMPSIRNIIALLRALDDGKVGGATARIRAKLVGRVALLQLQACASCSCSTDEVEASIGELVSSLAHPVGSAITLAP